jgi:hypothetical protein
MTATRRLIRLMAEMDLLRFRQALGRRTLPWSFR